MPRPAKNPEGVLPFPPYGAFISFLDDLHAMGPLPNRINAQVFKPSYSGSTVAQILRALRLFALTNDEGEPNQQALKPLINPETRRDALEAMFRHKYAGLFALPLATAGPGEVNEWFAGAGMDSTATRKAKAFFLTAARENGFETHPSIASRVPRRGPRGPRKRRAFRSDSTPSNDQINPVSHEQTNSAVLFHPAIDAYLRAARTIIENGTWDQAARDRVVRGFETQLDLFLPVKK